MNSQSEPMEPMEIGTVKRGYHHARSELNELASELTGKTYAFRRARATVEEA